MADLALLVGFS